MPHKQLVYSWCVKTTATLREHLTALQEAYETLPEHSHETYCEWRENGRSIPLTFKNSGQLEMAFPLYEQRGFQPRI